MIIFHTSAELSVEFLRYELSAIIEVKAEFPMMPAVKARFFPKGYIY